MTTNEARPKRRLKPFRKLVAEGYRRKVLSEQVPEKMIMEAKAVVIGKDGSPRERELIMEGFCEALSMMTDSGGKIVATAVLVE